jgi:hypothetical protein
MFKSGNNKGPMSWVGGAQKVVHHDHVVAVNNTVDGKDVDYWHGYAQGLKAQVAELVESRDALQKIAIERRANDAGLRAVIRYLLAELRKTQPNHPMLDKKNRDRIFDEFHKEEMAKALHANKMQMWDPLKRPDERQSP